MADVLFCPHLPSHDTSIVCGFLMCGVCFGVLALLWTLNVVGHQYKKKPSVSAFMVLLIINDILELILNLYVIAKLFQGDRCEEPTCRILSSFWSGLRVCGVFLQQMMVLETDLALRNVLCCAAVFFPCSFVISAIGFMFFFKWLFSSSPPLHLFTLLPPLAVTVTSFAVTCGTPASKIPSSNKHMYKYGILTVAALTMMLYLLFLIAYFSQGRWGLLVVCLLSLRMIIDPLLCASVCREKLVNVHLKSDQTF